MDFIWRITSVLIIGVATVITVAAVFVRIAALFFVF